MPLASGRALVGTHRAPVKSLSISYVNRRGHEIGALVLFAFALDVFAAVGLSYVAGFHVVGHALGRFGPIWMVPVVAGIVLSFVGYYFSYKQIYRTEDGPGLPKRDLRALVIAGFGGFFAHGGAKMDQYALQGAGASEREGKVRVSVLGGLEHGALGIVGTVAGVAALLLSRSKPPLDFQVPWAVIPLPGMLLAFWLAERYRERFHGKQGLREKLGIFLDSIHLIWHMFRHPLEDAAGPLGMVVFWLVELGATWSALAAFGFRMDVVSFALGFLTGAVFTRRTGPLAGAGILMLCLPVTIWFSGAPWGAAIAGVFAVRFVSFWLPLPFAIASLPTLRKIAEPEIDGEESYGSVGEPALEGRKAG
jgi:hypothetical protein